MYRRPCCELQAAVYDLSVFRILQVLCEGYLLSADVDFARLAHATPGYVGADLKTLVRRAMFIAAKRTREEIQRLAAAKNNAKCSGEELDTSSRSISQACNGHPANGDASPAVKNAIEDIASGDGANASSMDDTDVTPEAISSQDAQLKQQSDPRTPISTGASSSVLQNCYRIVETM